MKPFHFIPLKYQEFGEEEVVFKNQKSLFKSVKSILVLNVAFAKSVVVLIKNGCTYEGSLFSFETFANGGQLQNIW